MEKHKVNKMCLLESKGFSWSIRYSSDENTDDMARWARIGYFNGFNIAWISGFVSGGYEKLDHKRIGKVDFFIVTLHFPTSAQQESGVKSFDNLEDAKKYTEEMFLDFRNLIQDENPKPIAKSGDYCAVCGCTEFWNHEDDEEE